MAKLDKWELQHRKDIARYERQIKKIYDEATKEAAKIGALVPNFDPNTPFSAKNYPSTAKKIKALLSGLNNDIQIVILNGVESQWTLANNKNNELCNVVFGNAKNYLSEAAQKKYYSNNDKALQAFIKRKDAGMKLSDRVWKYTDFFREQIEMSIDISLRDGASAAEMGRALKQYLKEPDKLFRRVRDEHGELHLSKNAKSYKPGPGVYRSSSKNAYRLARTENNLAYRYSDYERWQKLDFITGIRVSLSNNHTLNGKPFTDMCDALAGVYPKTFKFGGWHTACLCFATPIMKTEAEMKKDNERIMNGEDLTEDSINKVIDTPSNFKQWVKSKKDSIENAKSMPYFLRDNKGFMNDALSA